MLMQLWRILCGELQGTSFSELQRIISAKWFFVGAAVDKPSHRKRQDKRKVTDWGRKIFNRHKNHQQEILSVSIRYDSIQLTCKPNALFTADEST